MIITVNRDVRVESSGNGRNVLMKICPYDQEGREAKPVIVEVKHQTAHNLMSALSHYMLMEGEE